MFAALHDRYDFWWDLAATPTNSKRGDNHFSIEDNALARRWAEPESQPGASLWLWCNPPYSKPNLDRFTAKARAEVQLGAAIVMLVPATVGAGWFQRNVLAGHDIMGGGGVNPAEHPMLQGWEMRLSGNGYEVKVRFLKRRVSFFNPWQPDAKGSSKTDSALIEWRPRRLL